LVTKVEVVIAGTNVMFWGSVLVAETPHIGNSDWRYCWNMCWQLTSVLISVTVIWRRRNWQTKSIRYDHIS